MNIRKVSETATTITLGWDPVPGADGYRFYSAGVLRSKTMDPRRRTVKFSKGQDPYRVEAVALHPVDSGTYPADAPPPPPPPTHKKVAPRVAYKDGSSDARYCLKDFPGLRDEVASYDSNGLCLGGRSDGRKEDGITSALEIDGRPLCSLPMPGDPTKNTGSWVV